MSEMTEAQRRDIDHAMLESLSTWFEMRAKGYRGPHSFNDWDVSFMLARAAILTGGKTATIDAARHYLRVAELLEANNRYLERARAAETENARMKMPDMFWLWQDPEYACEGWQEALEESGELAGVVRFQTALQLPDKWGAHRVLTLDDNGDPDETEEALFDTEAEARACWPDSLAAARATLSKATMPTPAGDAA
jgi:hypothetical protein